MSEVEKIVTITKFVGAETTSEGVTTFVTSSNTQVTMDSWPSTYFRSARYEMQVTANTVTGTIYHLLDLVVLQDGANAFVSVFSQMYNQGSLVSFDADVVSNFLNILVTPVYPQTTIYFTKELMPI